MIRPAVPLLALALAAGVGFWQPARAETCDDLWYSRNEIYKAQGYCFRTRRGISAFGNAGCQYDNVEDVPLSANQRRTVAEIAREERARRCPR
jgi:hypothetical protein